MKRIISFLGILIFSMCSLFAYISSLSVGSLNDAFTFGIAENYDDLRSYGFVATLETSSQLKSSISLSGITFRNNVNPTSARRVDEIYAVVGKEFNLHIVPIKPEFVISIMPSTGFYIVGDLQFDKIQNTWHRMTDLPELHLPYCNEERAFLYPYVGLNSRFSLIEKTPFYSLTSFKVEVEADVKYAPKYKTSYAFGLAISQSTALDNYFKVGVGFTQAFSLHQFPLFETTTASESGLYVDFTGRLGLLRINYRLYTHTRRAYGGVLIGLYNSVSQRDHYYSTNDLMFSVGSEFFDKRMFTLAIRYAITPTLGVYASNAFGTTVIEYNEHTRQNTSKWHLGIDYEIVALKNDVFLPFILFGTGFKRALVTKDGTAEQRRVSVFRHHALLMHTQLGLRFFHDGRFRLGSTIYGLELSAGLSVTMGPNVENQVALYHLVMMDQYQPFIKIALYSAGTL